MYLTPSIRLLVGTLGLIGTAYASRAASGADATADLRVQALVEASCRLEGGTRDFGVYWSEQNDDQEARTRIKYRCPEGLDITLNLGSGRHPVDGKRGMAGDDEDDDDEDTLSGNGGNNRSMKNGTTALAYLLFTDVADGTAWTNTFQNDVSVLSGANSVPVIGKIPNVTTGLIDGLYADEVTITLVF